MTKKGFTVICNSCGREAVMDKEVHRASFPILITLIGVSDCGLVCRSCDNNIILKDKTDTKK